MGIHLAAPRPSRLTKTRHGVFCLRWIVPVRYRNADGKPREVRVSLRTRDLARARILAMEFNLAFERVRAVTIDFDPRKILTPWTIEIPGFKAEVKDEADLASFNAFLAKHPDIQAAIVDSIRRGVDPQKAFEAAMKAIQGAAVQPAHPQASGTTPTKLPDAIDLFAGSRKSLGGNRRGTAWEKRRTLDLLTEFLALGGRDPKTTLVHELTRATIVDFIEHYAKRAGKSKLKVKQTGATGPTDQVKAPKDAVLSGATVLKAVGHLGDFFVYAVSRQMLAVNPVDESFQKSIEGLRKKASKDKKHRNYAVFGHADLRRIFEPSLYLQHNSPADEFWAPLLGLYTGARLGELTRLTLDGILREDSTGIHYLHFDVVVDDDDDGDGDWEDEGVKNRNSVRDVPVPRQLEELGFLRYVDHIRKLGTLTLFPHRAMNATRKADPSKHCSRVFGKYLDKVGIRNKRQVFHSFRHTAISVMHMQGVPIGDTELIAGHAAQDTIKALEVAGSHGSQAWGQTQMSTYVHMGDVTRLGETMLSRLKQHMDRTLTFDLDIAGLRAAAVIVQEHTVASGSGTGVFKSGWHTNARRHADEMLSRLAVLKAQE